MPTATSSSSHTPAVKPGQTRPLPSSTTQLWPKTPERKRDLVRSVPATTPLSIGTSILQKVQIDTDEAQTYDSDKYEQYITQDFERHRVFIDIEVFMTHILRVPENWETLWERTIQRIKCDQAFTAAQLDYCCQCGTQGVAEASFYMPLVAMGNAILSISKSDGGPVQAETPQIYIRNDPKRILCGSMKNLSPDIVAVHETLSPHICSGIRDGRPLNRSNLTWAQPLQVLEVKPWDGALVDGSCMPRLKVNGKRAITSCDVHSELMWNRTRPTAEPRPPSHAVAGTEDKGGYLRTDHRQRSLGSRASSTPKAACGQVART